MIVWTIGFVMDLLTGPDLALRESMLLVPELVLAGEWWRLLTFPLAPPPFDWLMALIFIFFFMFYLTMGRNIEQVMGSWRYNLFLLTVWFGSAAGAMGGHLLGAGPVAVDLSPMVVSMLFAFATFFPTFTILFFFVVPLQIKWLAIVNAALLPFVLIVSPTMGDRVVLLGQCLGYLIFCGPFLAGVAKRKQSRVRSENRERVAAKQAFHVCATCGATELTHPERTFRMSTEFTPAKEFCCI